MSSYVFDVRWQHERDRLRSLEAIFDSASIRYLAGLGVTGGWRCLEIGCGAGGVALWLAGQVGGTGQVVATDLDTRFLDGHGQDSLEVRRHDILADPLEEGWFDLAHARAVLEHIPGPQRALDRVISAVRPGGWVLIEDVDFGGAMATALARYIRPGQHRALAERIYQAVEAVFAGAGADAGLGPRLTGMLAEAGLDNVRAEAHTQVVPGGTENWVSGTIEQLAGRLAGTGLVTAGDIGLFLALVADRSAFYVPPLMVSAWGQRPHASLRSHHGA
jgi:SAM-dependent methyltransferase